MQYYLVASLPSIALGDDPPWTPEEFLFHSQGALTEEERAELAVIVEDRPQEGVSEFAAWWAALDTQIRNTIARLRASRLNVDARPYLRLHSGFDVCVDHAVTDAMNHDQPMEREMALDRCRWEALNRRVLGDAFGLETVLAFALRLRMMNRWAPLTDKAGQERIEDFITENADQSLEP